MSKWMPFVSVVVPTLNRKELLNRCLASLQEQTYPKDYYEILVIDNGSQDGSWELLEHLARECPIPVRLYRNDGSYRVPAASRNLGVLEAKGELIAFTDSDCIAAPDWLEKGVRCFSAGVGVVKGKTVAANNGKWPLLARTVVSLSPTCYFETCNVFYRAEALHLVGGFARDFIEDYTFPYFGEDADLAYRVLQAGYTASFAEGAVVQHHVFRQSLLSWLKEPLWAFSWPYMVKKHRRMRKDFLYFGYFLTRMTFLFDVALIGTLMGLLVNPWFFVLAIPFIVEKYREGSRNPALRLVRLIAGTVRAILIFAVLATGSLRFRCVVL